MARQRQWIYLRVTPETFVELQQIADYENTQAKEMNEYARAHPEKHWKDNWQEDRTVDDVAMSVFAEGLHSRRISIGDSSVRDEDE